MVKDHIVVLGAGPGGYSAAFYAADQGYKVTLVDINFSPGGVCLHSGCIPSKAFLHISKVIAEARQSKEWGVDFFPNVGSRLCKFSECSFKECPIVFYGLEFFV